MVRQIIHYTPNAKALCGARFYAYWTMDRQRVTCKRCLARLFDYRPNSTPSEGRKE